MAFNLTANITARLANGGSIATRIRDELKQPFFIDVQFSSNAQKASQKLTDNIKGLNVQLKELALNGLTASKAMDFLSRSFGSFKGGVNELNKTAAATKRAREETKKATDSVAEFGRVSGLALRRNAGFLIATGAVYGLGRAITSSFGEAIRFEKELVKVAQVSNRSVASLKPLTDEITRLSTGLGVASSDLVDISLILAQAGLSANETRQALEALAKTTLAATFGDIRDTTEGAIALMAQFQISASDLGKALGSTNAVSAAFAVESEDIIAAVKRAGGVFAQTSAGLKQGPLETFNQFIATFSAVRATTRESAESIATGIRTIFTRIQRPATIQFLKELGIELTDLNGRFVGPFEAVNRLSQGLENLDRRGSSFARVAEELGGFRQIGKTLALLSSSTQRLEALQVAQQGQNSVNKDAEQAQQSLANAIAKTREEFTALIREIAQTKSFDTIVRSVLALANSFIKLADAVKPIIPLLSALALVKTVTIGASFLPKFKQSLSGRGFAKGGKVTGGKGGVDDIPARLTKDEYVINRKSARIIGYDKLDELNSVGFNDGGRVGDEKRLKRANQKLKRLRDDPNPDTKRIEEAVAERDAIQDTIRQKNLRNPSTSPRLAGLFGGRSPAFEANIGGLNVSANSGQNLVGELSEGKTQKRLADINARRIQANKNFNANELRLQQEELAANKARIEANKIFNSRQLALQQRELQIQEQRTNIGRKVQNSIIEASAIRSVDRRNATTPRFRQVFGSSSNIDGLISESLRGSSNRLIRDASGRFIPENRGISDDIDFTEVSGARLNSSRNLRSSIIGGVRRTRSFLSSTRQRIGSVLQSQFPTFSNFGTNSSTRAGEARLFGGGTAGRASLASRLRANLPRSGRLVAAGALAGGVLAGDRIGGRAGGLITGLTGGAFTGGALGSALGPVGAGVGAVVGGIVGAFNGFIQADLDAKIKDATTGMITSISDVENAFVTFQKSISSGANLDKAIEELNKSFSGLTQKTVDSARAERGLGTEFRDERLALTQAEKDSAFGGFSANRRKEIVDQENKDIEAFKNRQSDLSSASKAAQVALDEQIARGVDFDTALSKLSPNAQTALAFGNATSRNAQLALGQALRGGGFDLQETVRAQNKGGQLRINAEEAIKQQETLKKAERELANVNQGVDLFIERMKNLSATLDRASQAGESFRRSNEALLSRRNGGAGIRSQIRTNVFDNTRAFTEREISNEALRINAFLGNNANSREITQGVIGAKQLQSRLPSVLNALSGGVRSGAEGNILLPQLINSNFGGLPKVLRDKLQSDIQTKFFANEQASPDDIANALASGDVSDLQVTAQEVNSIFKKIVDVTNQKISEYEQVLDQFIQLNQEANQAQDNRLQILNDSANQEKQLLGQRRLSVADRSRGFNIQLGQFANRAGSGTSVEQLIARESQLNARREGSFIGAPDEIARQMALLTQQQQDSLRALELIVSNTDRQNALVEDLNGLIDSRREARQVFEDFAFGSPTERREIERNIDLARRQNEGEDFFGTNLKRAREGQRALQALVGATQGQDALKALDQRQIDVLDRSGASRLFGAAGVNPGVGVGGLLNNRDALFQGQFQQLQELNRQRGAAAAGIESINRRDANQFEQNGRNAFNSFQSELQSNLASGGLLDMLNNTLANLPEVIQIGGSVTHNINFNGLEAFAALEPSVRKMIEQHVNLEINRRLNPLTGETGPA